VQRQTAYIIHSAIADGTMRGERWAEAKAYISNLQTPPVLHHEDAIIVCTGSCASIRALIPFVRTFDDAGLDSLLAVGACTFAAAGEGLLALVVAVAPVDLLAVDLLAVALGFAAAGPVLGLTGAALLTAAVALPTACNNAT
jgi:hypothetical protein